MSAACKLPAATSCGYGQDMNSDDVQRLEQQVDRIEQHVAELTGTPVPGSREHLIQLGFQLTDESQARARHALAEARQRRARTDWRALRKQVGLPPERRPSPITDAVRLAKVKMRLATLKRQLGPRPPTE
jgi:hypothetical protein